MALVALVAMMFFEAPAQFRMAYGLDSPKLSLALIMIDKHETLDSTYLTVSYQFSRRAFERDDSLSREDVMELQMGKDYNTFFSRDLRDLDLHNTKEIKTNVMNIRMPADEHTGWEVLTDHDKGRMTVTNRLPFSEQVIDYEEAVPEITYATVEAIDTVMGYLCKEALCDFGGRKWKVWYSEEIPLPYGPWKLNGAPGLILKAADTENNFMFEAIGLTQEPRGIERYKLNRKRMEKNEWKEFEKEMYRNAGAYVRGTGAIVLISDDSEKGNHRLKEDWSEYYNPLER